MKTSLNILPSLDSLTKSDTLTAVQAEIAAVVEKVTTTPASELIKDMVDSGVRFGLKLVAAFLIYFIGAWLIRKIKGILRRTFEKKETGTIKANQTYLTPERSGAWSSTDPEMNAISIGEVALVTLPQEMFDSDGKYIKEESPFAMTLIMGYACSTAGYAAPDWAGPNGGYETVNGPFKLGTAEMFKNHYIKTLQLLFEQK